jgi:c-di-AMP phosphodiesterase-like protein
MTKEQFDVFTTKSNTFLKKAKLFYSLFIMICVVLFIGMFIYQVISFFMTFIMVLTIIALLFQFVFKEYVFYTRKYNEYQRIINHRIFDISDEVIEFFNEKTYQNRIS